MKRRPRIYYSDSQKALMWERWKQGWTLHEIDKLFDRAHSSIHRILAETGRSVTPKEYGPQPHCRCSNEKRSREPSWRGHRFGPSLHDWDEHHRQSAGRSSAMVGTTATGPTRQMQLPGTERGAPSAANSLRVAHWSKPWPTSHGCCGRCSRLLAGSSRLILATRATTCHTKPSTAVCSFKRVAS